MKLIGLLTSVILRFNSRKKRMKLSNDNIFLSTVGGGLGNVESQRKAYVNGYVDCSKQMQQHLSLLSIDEHLRRVLCDRISQNIAAITAQAAGQIHGKFTRAFSFLEQ